MALQASALTSSENQPADLWRGHRHYWLAQGAAWGAGALISIGQFVAHPEKDMSLAEAIFVAIASALLCVAISHVLRIWVKRTGLTFRPWLRAVLPGIAAVGVATFVLISVIFLLALTREKWRIEMWHQDPVNEFMGDYFSFFTLLLGWLVAYCAVQYQRQFHAIATERIELDAALQGAELRALRGQLNPHFLFNALNILRRLVDTNPTVARQAITRLAAVLRATLYRSESTTVELAIELECTEAYLELEKLRFEERLQIERAIDERLLPVQVPPFALLTLVENAVKHGITNKLNGGRLGIGILAEGQKVIIRVTNPGPLAETPTSGRLGLRNLQDRLRLLYRDEASFELSCVTDGLVVATVSLPIKAPPILESPPTSAAETPRQPL